jgi:hypothetical protein
VSMKRKAYLWFARPNRVVLLVSGCLLAGLIAGSARAIDPTFAPAPGSPVTVGTNPRSVAAADLNGDGKPDLAVANSNSNDVSVLLGDGAGGFNAAAGSPVAAGTNPVSLAAADLNGDGKPDLAVANSNSSNLTILLHTAGATALTLRTFAARRTGHGVERRWRTAQETALLGFNVYRSGVKVNRTLIAARGAVSGAGYRLVDRSGRVGAASTYRLQAVHADGTRVWIGRAVTRR